MELVRSTESPEDDDVVIQEWDLRSPERVIRAVARRVPLDVGAAYAVLVRDPARRHASPR